jgi:hypothetical protein
MKTIKSLLLAAFGLLSMGAFAQNAEEIVAKHIAALGGMEKLKSLNSVKMEGSLTTQGMDIPITITKLRDKGIRSDIEVMGTSNYQLANSSKGFVFMPVMGQTEPQEMTTAEYATAREQFNIMGSLANYKDMGSKLEYLGVEDQGGVQAHKLKLTKLSGEHSTYFLDPKTFFITKVTAKREIQGTETDVETTYKDYKQNDQGYWFAYTSGTMNGDISFTKISTNVAVDEKRFQP